MGNDANTVYSYDIADKLTCSVIALSNVNSEIVEQYSYDAFGEPNRTSSVGNPYLFTGRHYDPEAGLYYYRARYYSYNIGRFLQPDPIGYDDGMNGALFAIGVLQVEGQDKTEPDLDLAKYNIDMLETLEEKTKGNLSKNEKMDLENTLSQVRMAHVKLAG